MLTKLLKYDFKATARIFLLMYAALLVLAGLNAGFYYLSGTIMANAQGLAATMMDIFISLFTILYVLVALAVMVVTIVLIIMRFYRMLGNEGYLWFTLPVTANQHLLSKLITAFVWTIGSTLMVCISILVLALPAGWLHYVGQIPQMWQTVASYGFSPGIWVFCALVILVLGTINGTLMFYAAMSIGPNLTKSRLGGSLLAYVILYVAGQLIGIIELVVLTLPAANLGTSSADIIVSTTSEAAQDILPLLTQIAAPVNDLVLLLTVVLGVGYLLLSAALYLISRHFLTKKLNLA